MHLHKSFKSRLGLQTKDQVFDHLRNTLMPLRPTAPSYYVNWEKAKENTQRIEMALHQLDYILGKDDMAGALYSVLKAHPSVVEALPSVFASRNTKHLLMSAITGATEFEFLTRALRSEADIRKIVDFCQEIGLFAFLDDAGITSFTDYVYGVEVGIDTNGRKNRGGTQMEDSVEKYVAGICRRRGFRYLKEANPQQISASFGKRLTVDKVNRRFDFAVNTPRGLFLIETNFYDGGGSKLKSTAGEYRTLFDQIRGCGHKFIWITDGCGWLTTLNPLRETFDYTDYILNLNMVASGLLEDLMTS